MSHSPAGPQKEPPPLMLVVKNAAFPPRRVPKEASEREGFPRVSGY